MLQALKLCSATAALLGRGCILCSLPSAAGGKPHCCAGMLAADGRCKTLDASADGYVRSEAVAALQLHVLHSLGGEPETAPHLLVLGTAVNQDGRSSSLTAPSGPAQQALLKAALASASLPPSKARALPVSLFG